MLRTVQAQSFSAADSLAARWIAAGFATEESMAAARTPEGLKLSAQFGKAWSFWSESTKKEVRGQFRALAERGIPVRTVLMNFSSAVSADPSLANAWLMISAQVLERESEDRFNAFCMTSKQLNASRLIHAGGGYTIRMVKGSFTYAFDDAPDERSTEADPSTAGLPDLSLVPIPYSGARIRFDQATLQWIAADDTVDVFGVSGTFALSDEVLALSGAAIRWKDRPGLIGVSFGTSQPWYVSCAQPEFRIDRGTLRIPAISDKPIQGVLTWRYQAGAKTIYPTFSSYSSELNLRIAGRYRGLQLLSGVSVKGGKISYQSSQSAGMRLVLKDSLNRRKMEVRAGRIDFFGPLIQAENASLKMFHGNDSIHHPAVSFAFFTDRDRIEVRRGTNQQRNVPFSSSYFKMDFTADRLNWYVARDSVVVYSESAVAQVPILLQSHDHFDPEDFRMLKGVGFDFHPLSLVADYVRQTRNKTFFTADLAAWSKRKLPQIRAAMEFLHSKGMITYNAKTSEVITREGPLEMVRAAKRERDFDNLRIAGFPDDERPLATIDLRKGELGLRGIEEFGISDSLNLNIRPDSSFIRIGQNRRIRFNGRVTAGNFEINGKDFDFRYDSFLIRLNRIDSIRFLVVEKNAFGEKVRRRLSNSMVGLDSLLDDQEKPVQSSGTLYVNRPNNRSGMKNLPNYPRLDASAGGIFYFDRPDILKGVYDRSLFFVAPPFKLDSLNNSDKGAISFKGAFVSNSVLPVFRDELHTMPDNSLGFTHTIPAAGFALFGSPAKLKGSVRMDTRGLVGIGSIDYLAAHVESDAFTFYKDSVVAPGKSGRVDRKTVGNITFPQIRFPSFRMKWTPTADEFRIISLKDPFHLYDSTATLNGEVVLTSKGVLGHGRLTTRGSVIDSRAMIFAGEALEAAHSDFRVLTTDSLKPAFTGQDVRLKFDLRSNIAEINPEQIGAAALSFPYAQFKTSIPTARWDLSSQKIVMTKAEETPIEDSFFYTTRKDLDSLSFQATGAEYDISKQELTVKGIPYITVADARITPQNGEILILKDARIGRLINTTIVLDTLNGYHRLTDGEIDIVSRKSFNGFGVYNYVNAYSDTFRIRMSAFHLDSADDKRDRGFRQTVAYGTVEDRDSLLLAPRMYYKGRLTMKARKPALELDGYVRFLVRNRPPQWFRYSQTGEEKDILVDFDKAETEMGQTAHAGLHFSADHQLYVTFLEDKKSPDDEDFFHPSGILFYDTASREFRIEDLKKASGERLAGKVFGFDEKKSEVKFEGPVNLLPAQKDFQLKTSAIGFARLEQNDIRMNALLFPEFDAPPAMFNLMAQRISAIIKKESVPEGHGDPTELLYKLANQVGEAVAKDYEKRSLKTYVPLTTVAGLAKPLVFSNVDLRWSQERKAFYSTGELGLSHIGLTDINGSFEGFMEIRRNEDGSPVFHVFLKITPEEWYYFGYEDNRLMLNSSSKPFNALAEKRTNAGKAGSAGITYIAGSEEETFEWVNSFRSKYLGLDTPYDLNRSSGGGEAKKEKKKKEDSDDGF